MIRIGVVVLFESFHKVLEHFADFLALLHFVREQCDPGESLELEYGNI